MTAILIGYSALQFWLNGTDKYSENCYDTIGVESDFSFFINEELAQNFIQEYQLTSPVHLMEPEPHWRRSGKNYRLTAFIQNIPSKSFIKLKDRGDNLEVYVACPELAFLQAASVFDFCQTVKIGCMLCASYVRDDQSSMKQHSRTPVTTVKKIKRFLGKTEQVRGIKNAKRAIQYVSDLCNSPMEVNLAVIGKLPISAGGYGLLDFQMNKEITLKSEGAKLLGWKTCRGDMVWSQKKVVVEYESNLVHLDVNQHYQDNKRLTALEYSGYHVFKITAANVSRLSNLDDVMFMLRKVLDQKRIAKNFNNYQELRREIYQKIFKESICN